MGYTGKWYHSQKVQLTKIKKANFNEQLFTSTEWTTITNPSYHLTYHPGWSDFFHSSAKRFGNPFQFVRLTFLMCLFAGMRIASMCTWDTVVHSDGSCELSVIQALSPFASRITTWNSDQPLDLVQQMLRSCQKTGSQTKSKVLSHCDNQTGNQWQVTLITLHWPFQTHQKIKVKTRN